MKMRRISFSRSKFQISGINRGDIGLGGGRYRGISGGFLKKSGEFPGEHGEISGGYRGNCENISGNIWNLN